MRRRIRMLLLATLVLAIAGCASDPTPENAEDVPAPTLEVDGTEAGDDRPSPPKEEDKLAAREILERVRRCRRDCTEDCGGVEIQETLLKRAIELDPTLVPAYSGLAWHYRVVYKPKASLEVCHRMQTAFPDDWRSYQCLLSSSSWTVYRSQERTNLLRKIIELNPKHAEARKSLGAAILDSDPIEAYTQYRIAIAGAPYRGVPTSEYSELGRHLRFVEKLSLIRPKEGGDLLQQLIESGGSIHRKGWCDELNQFVTHEKLSGERDFQPGITTIRDHCESPVFQQATALQEDGKIDEAITAWTSLLESNIFGQDAYLNLLRLYLRRDQDDLARAVIIRFFDRERDQQDRCETARLRDVRHLVPELFAQLDQECGFVPHELVQGSCESQLWPEDV